VRFPYPLRFLLDISSPKGLVSKGLNSTKITLDQGFTLKCYDEQLLRRLMLSAHALVYFSSFALVGHIFFLTNEDKSNNFT